MAQDTPTPSKTTSYSTDQAPQRRTTPGPRQRKMSDYGKQLAEKQKARREYGLKETQFRRYFTRAAKSSVATGQALFTDLELRLDNILYRSGLAKSRRMARQLVTHGLVLVNDQRLNLPGYTTKPGDSITLKKDTNFEVNPDAVVPSWLTYSAKDKSATVERIPKADDLVNDFNPQLIIEFYSR
jgi:small subunit ribosomal protein S4